VTRLSYLARRFWVDALILAAMAGMLSISVRAPDPKGAEGPPWLDVLITIAFLGPLFFRRRFPMAAPLASAAVILVSSFLDGGFVNNGLPIFLVALGISAWFGLRPDRRQAIAGWAALQVTAVIVGLNDPHAPVGDFVWTFITFSIAWIIGFALGGRLRETDEARRLAEQAELEREDQARLAVAEERARIARELHDIVAHAVSVMVLHVGAVRHSLPPSADRDALVVVERTGRAALAEMRRLLGALREAGADADLAPQPGLGDLDALLAAFGRAGLPVRLQVDGEPAPLPPTLDLSAYRVVQEGLTNALKHAQASRADVVVRYGARELRIDVRDDGRGAVPGDGLGHGLVGIRERVKIYGGEMSARTVNGGGFMLTTSFPLEGPP